MKRILFSLAVFSLSPLVAESATVTLQFSSTQYRATNWADGTGAGGANLVWGILVDAGGDGFDFSTTGYWQGVDFSSTGTAQSLVEGGGTSDDKLILSPNRMVSNPSAVDGSAIGQNMVTTIAGVPTGVSGINAGDAFAIVWFDRTSLSGIAGIYENFGAFTHASFIIPPDGHTVSFASVFEGADPMKYMQDTNPLVPEPTAAALGLLGAAGFLRRRR